MDPIDDAAGAAGRSDDERPVTIVSQRDGDTGAVALSGELDLYGGDAVEAAVASLLADGANDIAVDAGSLTFVDSAGLGGLLAARAMVVEAGGEFRLGPMSGAVARIIDLAGVTHLLDPAAS